MCEPQISFRSVIYQLSFKKLAQYSAISKNVKKNVKCLFIVVIHLATPS